MASEEHWEGPQRTYRSQEELDNYGKISPPMGSYFRIPDEPEDLYMRGSAFRPPSTPSGSMAGLDSLQRTQASSMDDSLQKFSRQSKMYMSSHNPDYMDDLDYYNTVPKSGRDSRDHHLKESFVEHYGDQLARHDHIDNHFEKHNHFVDHLPRNDQDADHFARHDNVDDHFARHDNVDYHFDRYGHQVDDHFARQNQVDDHFARQNHVDDHFARQNHVDDHFPRQDYVDDHLNRDELVNDQFTRHYHVDQLTRNDNVNVDDLFARHVLGEDRLVRQDKKNGRLSGHDQRDNHLNRSGSLKNSFGGQDHMDDPYVKHDQSDSLSFQHDYVHKARGQRAQIQQKHRHQVHRSSRFDPYNNTVSYPDSYSGMSSHPNGLWAKEAAETNSRPDDRHYPMNLSGTFHRSCLFFCIQIVSPC
jgi:hypothetical protein